MDKIKFPKGRLLEFSHHTIEKAQEGIIWIHPNGSICRVNEAFAQMHHYSKYEIEEIGAVFQVNPFLSPEKWKEHWEETKRNQSTITKAWHKKKEGEKFPVEIIANYLEFDGKEYFVAFVTDITEKLKKEEELKAAYAKINALKKKVEAENVYLQEEIKLQYNFQEIITQNKGFKEQLRKIELVAPTDSTVLIIGESGTGKELLARSVHNLSKRANRPLVKVDCGTVSANLIESTLFGHEKGAFTGAINKSIGRFELADGGTIFLDEIGELPLELQPKLLRVLQEGEFERLGNPKPIKVNVRVIAATNKDLEKAVEKGTFREDLFYRLNVFPLQTIPLRERKDDISFLVQHFCYKFSQKMGKNIEVISDKLMQALEAYDWPGNVRELENLIERGVILSQRNRLVLGDWAPKKDTRSKAAALITLDDLQRNHILKVLEKTHWKISGANGAAEILGLHEATLRSRMHKLGIQKGNNH
ncbi:sigma-54 interaction domain-containing protein [Xanthovirga aplysinae]|uniref:sigma-54 interaction domain-containing protein n=1 Tax=Xanthovirga aplysinae TaxID=2529853 RepID=UPI0012BD3D21|nr:sigma 54-interacting transcriptional regulator [Xanthovirga aplysinae]MTI32183.1 PAS domain S-box protein [Xanthovirga aplysinae]